MNSSAPRRAQRQRWRTPRCCRAAAPPARPHHRLPPLARLLQQLHCYQSASCRRQCSHAAARHAARHAAPHQHEPSHGTMAGSRLFVTPATAPSSAVGAAAAAVASPRVRRRLAASTDTTRTFSTCSGCEHAGGKGRSMPACTGNVCVTSTRLGQALRKRLAYMLARRSRLRRSLPHRLHDWEHRHQV